MILHDKNAIRRAFENLVAVMTLDAKDSRAFVTLVLSKSLLTGQQVFV